MQRQDNIQSTEVHNVCGKPEVKTYQFLTVEKNQ